VFKIEVDEDGYQLVVDDEESLVTDYGDMALVISGGLLYWVVLGVDDKPEEAKIYRVVGGVPKLVTEPHEVEEVEFELEADEEDEEDEEEDEGDEGEGEAA
jgi:hypothetical protein